jgi:crotonobetainyl-CoA:carnitine CoA-transferase CaiB-like acyl-CoA transferase
VDSIKYITLKQSREKGGAVAAVLDGVKVIEVAGWTFVPAGGAVLADWGADVITGTASSSSR